MSIGAPQLTTSPVPTCRLKITLLYVKNNGYWFNTSGEVFAIWIPSDRLATTTYNDNRYLSKVNTTEYTPTADYHPATKKYVDNTISKLADMGFTPVIVETLPTSDIKTNTIYMILGEDGEGENIYEEWMYINGAWEKVGSTGKSGSSDCAIFEINTDITPRDWFSDKQEVWNTVIDNESLRAGLQEYVNFTKNNIMNDKGIPMLKINFTTTDNPISIDWEYARSDVMNLSNGSSSSNALPLTKTNRPTFMTFVNGIWAPHEYKAFLTKRLMVYVDWNTDDTATVTQTRLTSYRKNIVDKTDLNSYLSKSNTTSFTPTGDYNPATKKYVDDSIKTSITSALGGDY
jgi:hypothetical protein